MNKSSRVWVIILLVAAGYLAIRAATVGNGRVYVRAEQVAPEGSDTEWTKYVPVEPSDRDQPGVSLNWARTFGVWVAGAMTLFILSFLWGDNPFYRTAEAIVVGTSAAYAMVVAFWTGIVQNLFSKLSPDLIRDTVLPGLSEDQHANYFYIVPLVFGGMMLMRLAPQGGWISRWPLAFFIGATAGVRLLGFLEADFVRQVQSTVMPLVVMTDGSFDWRGSLKNITIIIGVLSSLVYFFFSVEHKNVVGAISRLGIWFLMVTFGAGFGYTVMGRIALISERLKFLFDDWLWLIDPLQRRIGL